VLTVKARFGLKTSDSRPLSGRGVPGPGSYLIKDLIGNQGVKHVMVPRRPNSAYATSRAIPGPGSYDAVEMSKPNAYVLSGSGSKAPGCKIGTENRSNFLGGTSCSPGPGAYAPADRFVSQKANAPGWGIGTSQRGPLSYIGQSPGPGSYSARDTIGEGPKSSMRPRTAVMLKNINPGPGSYSAKIEPVVKRPPTAVVGSGQRNNNFAGLKNAPGPGAYIAYGDKKGSSPSYSFGKERPRTNYAGGPGPGAYKVPCTFGSLPGYALPTHSEFEYV